MNIKQAKEEIFNTLKAYLAKDALGNYRIPYIRQRPVLLIGPPGIGKTQIMEQIAREAGVGLVSYTITHHTRQSAMGLPFIQKEIYENQEYSVTAYTMSEILNAVYHLTRETGLKEGVLFLDEINCVSETLAPMMLQFLQYKTFGNQKLPEGWMIVTAGNPPEYNRSVRDFDIVTLDRVRRMDIQADYTVWKEYAVRKGLHGAILSYLDARKENFYRIEASVDGPKFVTARGWEDLSEWIQTCENLNLPVSRESIGQYIQFQEISRDFANYLELYHKYREIYQINQILQGRWEALAVSTLNAAPFDEKLAVMGLLYSRLSESARETWRRDMLITNLHGALKTFRDALSDGQDAPEALENLARERREKLEQSKAAGYLDTEQRNLLQNEIQILENYARDTRRELSGNPEENPGNNAERNLGKNPETVMMKIREWFSCETGELENLAAETRSGFDRAFDFLAQSMGEGQELVLFITEMTAGYHTSWFVEHYGCDAYFQYNHDLLFEDKRRNLRDKINKIINAARSPE